MLLGLVVFFFVLSAFFAVQYFMLRTKLHGLNLELVQARVRLEEEKCKAQERLEMMRDTFKALSSDVLRHQQTSFFEVAKTTFEKYSSDMRHEWQQKQQVMTDVVKPLRESLEKVDSKIQDLEKSRISAYVSVSEQLKVLSSTQADLHKETNKLVRALRAPNVRGQWGELQLKRVVEMAGMLEHCDFVQQETLHSDEGRLRPDLIVKLPNERAIVIDAKTPLQAYLEAIDETREEVKLQKLKEHAKHIKKHLLELGEKGYWERLAHAPEFVVLFLPGESFFSAALEHDPELIEFGLDKKVLLATPTTLIALLKAVALGWREQVVNEHAKMVCELGKTMHERLVTMTEHFTRLKRSLDGSIEAYNKAVGSFESRVLPTARRFQEIGITGTDEIEQLEPIEKLTKTVDVIS